MVNMEVLKEVMRYMNYSSLSKVMDPSIDNSVKDYYYGIARATEFLLECTEYEDTFK